MRKTIVLAFLAGALPMAAAGEEQSERILYASAGWGWVEDSARLDRALRFASSWGYRSVAYAISAPAITGPAGDTNWIRDAGTGWRWKLSSGGRPGRADARGALIATIRARRDAASRAGFGFNPFFGPWGWGNTLRQIDRGTAAGAWYDIRLPAARKDAFRLKSRDTSGAVIASSGWGDPGGEVSASFAPDGRLPEGSVSRGSRGAYSLQFTLRPGLEAFWRLSADVLPGANPAPGDSASLRVYRFRGWETHPYSTKPVASASRSSGPGLLSTGFFARPGEEYLVDFGIRTASPTGASLRFRNPKLLPSIPPREKLIDASAYEASGPGGLSILDRTASDGEPGETEVQTRVSFRRKGWSGARAFRLDPAARDGAWDSLDAVSGHFADQSADPARLPVDPLSPATRQIVISVADAVAEALGRKPRYYFIGGDEVMSWESKRFAQPPYRGLDRGALLAAVALRRMRDIDSVFAARLPHDTLDISYVLFGDLLTSLNGFGEGTLGGSGALASAGLRPGKIVVAPWYYDAHVRELAHLRRKVGIPDSLGDVVGFEELLRRDVARISSAGLDFLPIYSTDGVPATLAEELGGARAWAAVCREFRDAANGRCRGMLYSGWDTDMGAEWGNGYNGFLATAWYGWLQGTLARKSVAPHPAGTGSGGAEPFGDADGDGVLDALQAMTPGPLAHEPPKVPAAAKAVPKSAAEAGPAAAKTPGQAQPASRP